MGSIGADMGSMRAAGYGACSSDIDKVATPAALR